MTRTRAWRTWWRIRRSKTPTAVAGWLVERMDTIDAWLDNAALQLRDNVLVTSRTQELRLQELSSHLLFHAKGLLRQREMALEQMRETLAASAGNFLARQTSRLGNAAELVAGRSPERILRLGFAIVRTGRQSRFLRRTSRKRRHARHRGRRRPHRRHRSIHRNEMTPP